MENIFRAVQQASRKLVLLDDTRINNILVGLADRMLENIPMILEANSQDLARMAETDPKFDRLKLTEQRVRDIASDVRNVASLPSPLGITLQQSSVKSGLTLEKVTVPLGVVGVIYEARPNVTFDVFALCLKSGNACILKGGSDAEKTNAAIVKLIHSVLAYAGADPDIIALLPADREAATALLNATAFVDVIIPRGSQNLINFVRANAKVPVIETGAGIVHTYVHHSADTRKASDVIFNAKTRRVSVCNALDCLLIDRAKLADLPQMVSRLQERNVLIYADDHALAALTGHYPASLLEPATAAHYGTEFLDYKMSIRSVDTLDQALDHIARYSSKHSEAILAEDEDAINQFLRSVDAAAVYANASTAFTDGAQFGLGAEIGISTQKLHARGPMALREMTSYKWIIRGNGTTRG
jgi:glutamate-5-semialdehyde dehydrogenase